MKSPDQESVPEQINTNEIKKIMDELYDYLWSESRLNINEVSKKFKEAETKISSLLKKELNNPDISIELDSDDSMELYDGDWTSPPIIIVSSGGKEIGRFEALKENEAEKFISEHKK